MAEVNLFYRPSTEQMVHTDAQYNFWKNDIYRVRETLAPAFNYYLIL